MRSVSRDAFPARGGTDDKPDRFPLSPRPGLHGPSAKPPDGATHADEPCGSIDTQSAQSCDSPVTDSPLPSGPGSPGWVGARDGTPSGARPAETATAGSDRPRSAYVELHAHS